MFTDEVAYRLATPVALGQGRRINHKPGLLKSHLVFLVVVVKRFVLWPVPAGIERVLVKVTHEQHVHIAAGYSREEIEVVSAKILHFVNADQRSIFLSAA